MAHYIDRRLNPNDKSIGNRQRFVKRVRDHIKHVVDQSIKTRSIENMPGDKKVSIPMDGIREPGFHADRSSGNQHRVLTGNRKFLKNDQLEKPPDRAGAGQEGSDQGDGEDEFFFMLSRDEFLDIFFEDLELPDLVKLSLKEIKSEKSIRAGYSITGSSANISVKRTMRNALGRRWALKRPRSEELSALRDELFKLEAISSQTRDQNERVSELHEEIERLGKRQRKIPYIDPLDVRYNHFEKRPEPNANAVMFCLMDVSASMGEREKDLAKRFFVLLHLFLNRRYKKVDLVFIRHTQNAEEVDEETFFYSPQTGGTIVSTALVEMRRIIRDRYPPSEWNIYGAQASDGENFRNDSARCAAILDNELMTQCQYFAYIEIVEESEAAILTNDDNGIELWRAYRMLRADWPNFAMKRISRAADIYPVFRELFARRNAEGQTHV